MHHHLRRQLQNLSLEADQPPSAEAWSEFLEQISNAYDESDRASKLQDQAISVSNEEMRAYHDELLEAQQRLQLYIEASTEAILIHQLGIATDINDQVTAMFGYERDEVVGSSVFQVLAPEFHDYARKSMTQGLEVPYEARVIAKDKTEVPVIISPKTLVAGDKPLRFVSIQDISKLKAVQQELEDMNAELEDRVRQRTEEYQQARDEAEQANQSKSRFLASMSHELRTPLNSILGFAQLMKAQGNLSERHQIYVEHTLKAGRHLLELINDVLDLEKIEAGTMELSIGSIGIGDLLDACYQMVLPLAREHEISLEFTPCEDVIAIGDKTRVMQVFINILENGIKYNTAGGQVKVWCQQNNDFLEICFEDSGIGISGVDHDKVFEPFVRLRSIERDGAGVGLNIASRYLQEMGGNIRLESVEGMGSKFYVALPSH